MKNCHPVISSGELWKLVVLPLQRDMEWRALFPSALDMRTKPGISLEFSILKETSQWTRELSVLISQQVLSPKRVKKKNLKGGKERTGTKEIDSSFYCPFCLLSCVMFYAGELQAGLMMAW